MLIYSHVNCAFSSIFALSCTRLRNFKTASKEPFMTEVKPSFFPRLSLAFAVFWRIIVDPTFAASVLQLRRGPLKPSLGAGEPKPVPLKEPPPDSALQLLGLLQQHGRFIDFVEEAVDSFTDAQVGAAARVVHEGCRTALQDHFTIEPIRTEQEGTRVTVDSGFDPAAIRLTGNVVGEAPFSGSLLHRGWRATLVKLPKLTEGHDVRTLAAAEVEL
jgi:hypothetical protein